MAPRRFGKSCFRLALCLALATAQGVSAAQPGNSAGGMAAGFLSAPQVLDVALSPSGALQGQVVTRDGAPARGTPLVLFKGETAVAKGEADEQGRFAFDQLQGGMYVIAAPGGGRICRAWAPGTAPPPASPQVLVVTKTDVVRGQTFCPTSLYEWFETHPVLGYTAVTAAIALPIILLNLDDDDAS